MVTKKVYLEALTAGAEAAAINLMSRLGWKLKFYDTTIEATIPEEDIEIFDFMFDSWW